MNIDARLAAIAAVATGVVAAALLVACDGNTPIVGVATGAVAAAPILAIVARPTWAVIGSGIVTVAAPFFVDCGNVVVYAFVATLIVYTWRTDHPRWLALAGGLLVFTINEVVSEAAGVDAVIDATDVVVGALEAGVLTLLVVGLGTVLAVTERQAESMLRLEQANRELALQDERHRIARDLHDVAAHHLSSITVRTRTATKLGDDDDLRQAVTFAGDAADDALAAMRQIVSVLRTPQGDEIQPSVSDLDGFIARATEAGVAVESTIDKAVVDAMNRPCELAVVRIAQEALSNVMRHSDSASAALTLTLAETEAGDLAVLTVSDDGPASSALDPQAEAAERGFGIIGMRERAVSLGGTLVTGPTDAGGWHVEARIPVRQRRSVTDD